MAEIFVLQLKMFAEGLQFVSQGWIGTTLHVDAPVLTNLRLDPFERLDYPNGTIAGSQSYFSWFQYEFWRFVFVQQEVAKLAVTAIEYPPIKKARASTWRP